jgi:hypothetical protein
MRNSAVERHAGRLSARAAHGGALLVVALMVACGAIKPAPPVAAPQSGAPQVDAATGAPVAPPPAAMESAPAASVTARPPAAPPATKTPAPVAAAPVPGAQPAKKATGSVGTAKPTLPTLDLQSLETELKQTNAIGVMTKIALKNQVDDLLNQFRAFYAGKLKTTLAELRRPYDLLVLKVLSLLQDSDPSLAAAIVASREAIWGILSDPAKFATI